MRKTQLKKALPFLSVALLCGCAGREVIDVSTWRQHYNPTTDARIRILAQEKEL